MVVLLNLIPLLVLAIVCLVWLRYVAPIKDERKKIIRTAYIVYGYIITMIVYSAFQPSYISKGEVRRIEVPQFERSEAPIENRMRRTDTQLNYERVQRMHREFMEGKE